MRRHRIMALIGILLILLGVDHALSHHPEQKEAKNLPQTAPEKKSGMTLSPSSIAGPGEDRDLQALREMVVRLGSEVAALRGQLHELAAAVSQAYIPNDPAVINTAPIAHDILGKDTEFDSPGEFDLAQEEERYRRRSEAIARSFWSEPLDSRWSTQATHAIESALYGRALEATQVFNVECRETLCRMETHHSDPEKRMEFEAWLINQVGSLLPRMMTEYIDHDDGSTDTIVYLAREGFDFSQIIKQH